MSSTDNIATAEAPRLPNIREALGDAESLAARLPGVVEVGKPSLCSPSAPAPEQDDINTLRERCATLAADLAAYADANEMVTPHAEGLGFTLAIEHGQQLSPRHTGIQLLLSALLRLQDDVTWQQRQQLPAALFGQLLIGAYDLPFTERPALTVGLERLPDAQLEQLYALIRHARQLIELTLSSAR